VPDLAAVERDPHLQLTYDFGWRSVLVAPMLRRGEHVGALVIRRKTTGEFSPGTVDLLETFASQSALAIYNAGLFRELEIRTEQLQVARRGRPAPGGSSARRLAGVERCGSVNQAIVGPLPRMIPLS
jgi:GAF domain-containing protein